MMINTVLWMLGTIASFCLMAIAARELTGDISVFQILFIRSLLGLIIITPIILWLKRIGSDEWSLFATKRPGSHLVRNVFHFGGQAGWVLGIGLLPLAEVFALEFTVPVWTAIIAATVLGEKVTLAKVAAMVFGLIGVVIIVRPGLQIFESAAMIVLLAAVFYAVAHTMNKSLTNTEHPLSILFYMCLMQFPLGFVLSVHAWVLPQGIQWLWLVTIGVTALTGHFCLSKAMQRAEVTIVMTLDFLRLPVIAILAVWLYGEEFDLAIIIGGVLILIGNRLNLRSTDTRIGVADRKLS